MYVEGYLEYHGYIIGTVGGYLVYLGDTRYRRDIMMHVGDIMMHVGDIMSTVRGCSVQWGKIFCYSNTPNSTKQPHGTHDIPTCIMISLHSTEHSPRYSRYLPKCIMISPTVLNAKSELDWLSLASLKSVRLANSIAVVLSCLLV